MTATAAKSARVVELPKILDQDEVDALFDQPNLDCPTGLRDRCILELMYRCGLRVSETCGLHLRDIKRAEHRIHLRPEITKGHIEAVIPYGPRTAEMLERWIAARRPYAARKKHLFTTLQGGPVSRFAVYKMMRRRAGRAGITRDVSPHMLRHTYATRLMASRKLTLIEVQRLLRHQDVRTTMIYLHVADAQLAQTIYDLELEDAA